MESFDVIVVGGGHAGAEAASAAARLGATTALVSFDPAAIGRLSCNPAVGGIGKGQIVREIDALGGLMGRVTDATGIQFRMLNRRKGPALWAPRAQVDSQTYPAALQRELAAQPGLTLVQGSVEELCVERAGNTATRAGDAARGREDAAHLGEASRGGHATRVTGVRLADGRTLAARAVIITAGTFLRGLMHTGERQTVGGRVGEAAAVGLSAALERAGLTLARLKTGTPPRVARETVDFAALTVQPGDERPAPFSFLTERLAQEQVPCWITWTSAEVHALIRANLQRAPLFSGQIQSRGPRYCPSIEDKVVRFAEKERHQLFIEPEGRDSPRLYLNGLSTSLPEDVQRRIVGLTPGLERARIVQWGYAVEYDFVPPTQIDATLMSKRVAGLFLAGQICGTSGYEEAAGQGLLAGVNAARWLAGRGPVVLGREQAYIGVMIDDLVTRELSEPYRMFSSRAEHRLHLRYDNADARLTPLGRELGLVDDARWARFEESERATAAAHALVATLRVDGRTVAEWLRRPEEDGARFVEAVPELGAVARRPAVWGRVLTEIKYAGYLERQARLIERLRTLEDERIPADFDFAAVPHLRREAVEQLTAVRPRSLGQAARVSGVHASDVSLIMLRLRAS